MRSDRNLRFRARYIQRPGLALISHQPLLRRVFEADAALTLKRFHAARYEKAVYGGVAGLRIVPNGLTDGAPRLLYFHGGGFTIGSPRTHRWMVARLCAQAQCEAFVPAYRLAPEHPYPAAQEDARAGFDSYAPDFVAGDSAGGCLTLHLCANRSFRAAWLLSPLGDQSRLETADFSQELLIPPRWPRAITRALKADVHAPQASPLLGDLSKAPPALIQVGRGEVLEPDAQRAAQLMPEATLSLYDGMPHVWQLHAGHSATADRAITEAAEFLSAQ